VGEFWLYVTIAIALYECVYGGTAAGAQCLRLSERFFIAFAFGEINILFLLLAGCRKRQLNQAPSVFSLSLDFF